MKKEWPKRMELYESPIRLLILIALTIFFTHMIAMLLFGVVPHFALWAETAVQSALLLVLLFPVLYFFSFRPLILHIAEREQAVITMLESEFKYQSVFENASDAVFLLEVESGRILDTNPQAEHLLNRTRREIMGMNQSKLYPPDTAEYDLQQFATYVQQDEPVDFATNICRKDGSRVSVRITGVPTFVHGKRLILAFIRDASLSGTQGAKPTNTAEPAKSR
jgi:PAS domain S-box-containing protein